MSNASATSSTSLRSFFLPIVPSPSVVARGPGRRDEGTGGKASASREMSGPHRARLPLSKIDNRQTSNNGDSPPRPERGPVIPREGGARGWVSAGVESILGLGRCQGEFSLPRCGRRTPRLASGRRPGRKNDPHRDARRRVGPGWSWVGLRPTRGRRLATNPRIGPTKRSLIDRGGRPVVGRRASRRPFCQAVEDGSKWVGPRSVARLTASPSCAVKGGVSQWVQVPPGQLSRSGRKLSERRRR
jgi:hypothetical protein